MKKYEEIKDKEQKMAAVIALICSLFASIFKSIELATHILIVFLFADRFIQIFKEDEGRGKADEKKDI